MYENHLIKGLFFVEQYLIWSSLGYLCNFLFFLVLHHGCDKKMINKTDVISLR